jgi:hypothetical protein
MNNPFKKYTDHLAETLESKNKAYGDSFTKSVGPLMVNLEASQTELLPDNEESKNTHANNK